MLDTLKISFVLCLAVWAGCEPPPVTTEPRQTPNKDPNDVGFYVQYAAAKIDILPLTELAIAGDDDEPSQIRLYVSLLDPFGSQIKSPGIFRFELYRHVQRSAEPKGGRIVIWPDIDLTDPGVNDKSWRDFLRCYQFSLDLTAQAARSYVLQATCLCPNGRRLSTEFLLKSTD